MCEIWTPQQREYIRDCKRDETLGPRAQIVRFLRDEEWVLPASDVVFPVCLLFDHYERWCSYKQLLPDILPAGLEHQLRRMIVGGRLSVRFDYHRGMTVIKGLRLVPARAAQIVQ
jgi:hypothetical protein